MSSFIRRIQRQTCKSRYQIINPKEVRQGCKPVYGTNPPRGVFYMGRGSKLGVRNPKAKDLLARQKREAKRASM